MSLRMSVPGGDAAWNAPSPDGDETEDVPGLVLMFECSRKQPLSVMLTRTFADSAPEYGLTVPAGSPDEPTVIMAGPFGNPDELFGPLPTGPLKISYPSGIDGLRVGAASLGVPLQ